MKKRLTVFLVMLIFVFSNAFPSMALENGGDLDIGSGAGDSYDWETIEKDYSVELDCDVKTIKVGQSFQVTATVKSESQGIITNAPIEWSSDDSEVASVNSQGVVTGISVGRTHINGKVYGIKRTCVITVVENGEDTPVNPPIDEEEKLTVKSVTLSATQFIYNGKVQKPSVKVLNNKGEELKNNAHYTLTYVTDSKNVGKYSVILKFKGKYKETKDKSLSYEIVPKGTTMKGLTAGKKKITIVWNKQSKQVNGYQIQCCLKKNFKNKVATLNISGKKKTKVTLTGLKSKKKYFVRIRTYKNVKINGKTAKMYSGWSSAKKIKIK